MVPRNYFSKNSKAFLALLVFFVGAHCCQLLLRPFFFYAPFVDKELLREKILRVDGAQQDLSVFLFHLFVNMLVV